MSCLSGSSSAGLKGIGTRTAPDTRGRSLLALRGSQVSASEALRNAERVSRAARAEVAALVHDMLAAGGSWSEIAAALGTDESQTKRRYGGGGS